MCTDEQHTHKITLLESIDRSLSLHRTQPFIDDTVSISATQPFIVDRKGRKFLYIWSAISFTATIEDLGTLTVPSNVWVSCGFAEGMRLVPSASVTVYVRATDNIIGSALNNLTGNRTSAYSTPVTIASDQTAIPVFSNYQELANLSAGALNADLLPAMDVSFYRQIGLQTTGGWNGTLAFQCSNDGVNYGSFAMTSTFPAVIPDQTFTTSNAIFTAPLGFRWVRIRMTGYVSGAVSGTVELYASPTYASNQFVQAFQQGNWSLSASASGVGSSDFHLISAATTNATNIKTSAGNVYGWSIYNAAATARYVKLFNKATTPTPGTDTPYRTIGIPALSAVDFSTPVGIIFSTGIGFATTTGITDSDATAVSLSDLAIDIDWK